MKNLGALLQESVRNNANRPFMWFMRDDELAHAAFGEFGDQVKAWAAFLREQGITEGDRVAFITPKSPNQVRAFYACWWLGAISVPISETLGELEMGFVVRDSEPKIILVDESMVDTVSNIAADEPVIPFGDIPLSRSDAADLALQPVPHDDVAALIYTSGSTGMPKGVMLTHANLCVNGRAALDMVSITDRDLVVSLLPYWHSFALVVEVIMSVTAGFAIAIPRDKRDFSRNIATYKPTVILVVPRIADALMRGIRKKIEDSPAKVQRIFGKAIDNASRVLTAGPRKSGGVLRKLAHRAFYDPVVFKKIRQRFGGRLRFFIAGGAPLDIEHQVFFKRLGIPIYVGYGLTESTPVISVNSPEEHKLGSCGRMLPWLRAENGGNFTFKADDGSTGKDVHGELLVKGDCVMKGYWRHRDASAKTLADGWLHTGDVGYVDEDGYLFLDGRQGNMLVLVGGEKLHPEHVEDSIKNAPFITEAMVIGEGCKNVYVCVNVDVELTQGIEAKELVTVLRDQVAERTAHLAPFQRPRDVLVLPEFSIDSGTLTVTLKVRRHAVWDRYGDRIREFLRGNGEDVAARQASGVARSGVMESLGRDIVDGPRP